MYVFIVTYINICKPVFSFSINIVLLGNMLFKLCIMKKKPIVYIIFVEISLGLTDMLL